MTKLRQLWLLTALGAVVILAGGYFLLVSPKSGHAKSLRAEAQSQQDANRALQGQINLLNKQKKDLPAKQLLLAHFANKIPNNPALPTLVRTLSDAADRSGVELFSVSPAAPVFTKLVDAKGSTSGANVPAPGGTVLATIPVRLVLHGNYSNITQFFAELETMNRALLVTDVNFALYTGAGGASGTGGAAAAPAPTVGNPLEVTIGTNVLMTTKPAVQAPVAPATSTDTSAK